jgi:hypothetical protein
MAHFCLIKKNIVKEVIVIDNADAPTEEDGKNFIKNSLNKKGEWVQTSYNSHAGVHYVSDYYPPSGQPHFRYNFGEVGFTYDKVNDAFYAPDPLDGSVLDTETFTWKSV